MNESPLKSNEWSENIILVDADYIDKVAFDLIVNFERMIGRRIPRADMARWIDCVALDGGIREGENTVQVVLIHANGKAEMDNFTPSKYRDELDGKAFRDHLGEFVITAQEDNDMITKSDLFLEILAAASSSSQVKRIMVIPNANNEDFYDSVRHCLRNIEENKRATVFAMQPMQGGNFRQEILGYSLMNALGIRAEEIH